MNTARKILLLFLTILFSNVALCQTENELNNMIVESITKFIDAYSINAKYPQKDRAYRPSGKKGKKITVDKVYYCIDGLPLYFNGNHIVINGVKPISVFNYYYNDDDAIKDLKKTAHVINIGYYIKSNEITIFVSMGLARRPHKRRILIGRGVEPARYIYRYSCESNTWELVESK